MIDKYTINIINQISKDINEDPKWITSQIYEDIQHMSDSGETQTAIQIYINNLLTTKQVGWNHPCFAQYVKNQQEQDDYILNPFEVEEGVIECPRCKSSKVFSMAIQTRAADEPTTTMAECTKCKLKWSQNN
jgi:DNA-directed RNA polymerase subunit M/transcription elongation factor TFIIS